MPRFQPLDLPAESRYKDTQAYSSEEYGAPLFGPWERPEELDAMIENAEPYTVRDADIGRLDLLAYQYYDNVRLWWLIAAVNNLIDPLTEMYAGQRLWIPDRSDAENYLSRQGRYFDGTEG